MAGQERSVAYGHVYAMIGRKSEFYSGYSVSFLGGGRVVSAQSGDHGEYEVDLEPENYYVTEVRGPNSCIARRPRFYVGRNTQINIDFLIVHTCGVEFMAYTDDLHHVMPDSDRAKVVDAVTVNHIKEIPINGALKSIIMLFGYRDGDIYRRLKYAPLGQPYIYTAPPMVYAGNMTVQSESVIYDDKRNILKSLGAVFVSDGGPGPRIGYDCVELDLNKADPAITPCASSAPSGKPDEPNPAHESMHSPKEAPVAR